MSEIITLTRCPDDPIRIALEEFEARFRYPLGEGRWFTISHGDDYTRFFRAIGPARCFVSMREGRVLGVISATRCGVTEPDGTEVEVAYLSDLKLRHASGGKTLLKLLSSAASWARRTPQTPGFAAVMDGTAKIPPDYTGRLGIPPFRELTKLSVLRIGVSDQVGCRPAVSVPVSRAPVTQVRTRFAELTSGRYATVGGDMGLRSVITPTGLLLDDGAACGVIEDTRRCKLLYQDDGEEMVSAHLSLFAYQTMDAAVNLLRAATLHCRSVGLPAMFVSVPRRDAERLRPCFAEADVVKAPATVYGFGFSDGIDWSINTSEI